MSESWNEGDSYERYMGRWSIPMADVFLSWLEPDPGLDWLDVGCGTGALSGRCAVIGQARKVLGIDFSPGYIARARKIFSDPQFEFQVGSAVDLPVTPGSFDFSVSGLALNFFPDPLEAVREMVRVLRPGGTAAVYIWDYAGRMEMLRHFWDAAAALDPRAADLDEGRRFPICQPDRLESLFNKARLEEISVMPLDTRARFLNFEDFWHPFLMKNGPAPAYVAGLTPAERDALAGRLRKTLPAAEDGSITLILRAWAVKGRLAGFGGAGD